MADTEDYLEEATPSAHHESHEDAGTDEMSLAGLALDPADMPLDTADFDGILSAADDNPQKALDTVDDHGHAQLHDQNTDIYLAQGTPDEVAAHTLIDVIIYSHAQNTDQKLDVAGPNEVAVADIKDAVDLKHAQVHATEHVTGGGDVVANAVAAGNAGLMTGADKTKLDTEMGIHEALPTVHQDAPDLILTHKGDASAHHAYIEGTWTPIFISTGASFTYTSQYGWIRKLGSLVIAQFYLLASASGTVTNSMTLGGLPYTQVNLPLAHGSGIVGFTTFTTFPSLVGTPNTTYFTLFQQSTTTSLTPTTAGMNVAAKYLQAVLIFTA